MRGSSRRIPAASSRSTSATCRVKPGGSPTIERLAIAVTQAGSSLVLAADSVAMAEHAAGLGLIAEDAVAEVRGERDDPLAVAATDPDQPASVVIE